MGLIVDPSAPALHLTTATGKEVQDMPVSLWHAVEQADMTLRRHGMQMVIICEHCNAAGHPHPIVAGDNSRHATVFKMECPHLERRISFTT